MQSSILSVHGLESVTGLGEPQRSTVNSLPCWHGQAVMELLSACMPARGARLTLQYINQNESSSLTPTASL